MNKNWSLILVFAFSLGFGLKLYFDNNQAQTANNQTENTAVFLGANQKNVDLFDETDPRVRVVYFGFTHCPDVCPTSLAMLSAALNQLDTTQQDKIRPIFITLDPERDIASKAHEYAQYFHPKLEGLSAELEITKPLAEKYGVVFKRTELKESKLAYTIDHNSYFYFLQPNGELITKVPHTLNPAPIVLAIENLE